MNAILTVKIRMVVWVQNAYKYSGCLSLWLYGWLGAAAAATAQHLLPVYLNIPVQKIHFTFLNVTIDREEII